ncbi:hypothetical protein TSMEX_002969 [Taenia solium]|eukprot:TsM_001203400 transcript=TsM_001203400 gene=TsM_001203400
MAIIEWESEVKHCSDTFAEALSELIVSLVVAVVTVDECVLVRWWTLRDCGVTPRGGVSVLVMQCGWMLKGVEDSWRCVFDGIAVGVTSCPAVAVVVAAEHRRWHVLAGVVNASKGFII